MRVGLSVAVVVAVVRGLDRAKRQARVPMRPVVVVLVRPRTVPVREGSVHAYLNSFQKTAPTLRWRPDFVHGMPVARDTRRFAFVMPS